MGPRRRLYGERDSCKGKRYDTLSKRGSGGVSTNADGQGREAGGRRGSCCCRSFNAILQVTAWANQDESARSERRCGGNIKLNLEQREGETRANILFSSIVRWRLCCGEVSCERGNESARYVLPGQKTNSTTNTSAQKHVAPLHTRELQARNTCREFYTPGDGVVHPSPARWRRWGCTAVCAWTTTT